MENPCKSFSSYTDIQLSHLSQKQRKFQLLLPRTHSLPFKMQGACGLEARLHAACSDSEQGYFSRMFPDMSQPLTLFKVIMAAEIRFHLCHDSFWK